MKAIASEENMSKSPGWNSRQTGIIEGEDLIRPHFYKGRFYNHPEEKIWHQFFKIIYALFPGMLGKKSNEDLTTWARTEGKLGCKAGFTWIGHSSLLIKTEGFHLLFDPVFEFVGPWFFRHTKAGILFEELPPIDILAISHNHADHFSRTTIKRLKEHLPFVFAPKGLGSWFKKKGFEDTEDFDWWSYIHLERDGKAVRLTAVPAKHSSQFRLDLNRTLWMGIVVEADGKTFYFAGDTAHDPKIFSNIRKVFGTIDVAFLPISPEDDLDLHLTTEEALRAFEHLDAKWMVPIHYGAYRLSNERVEEPIERLQALLENEYSHLQSRIIIPRLGELIPLDNL